VPCGAPRFLAHGGPTNKETTMVEVNGTWAPEFEAVRTTFASLRTA
jgi:hypothetical protein